MSIAYGFNEKGYFTSPIPMQKNPFKQGEYLVPSNATLIEPPDASSYSADKLPLFNEDSKTWELVDSPAKIADDNAKLEVVNDWGVCLYERDSSGNVVLRDVQEVDSETTQISTQFNNEQSLKNLKETMDGAIIQKSFEMTGASSIESAQAFMQAFQVRIANASKYVNDGLVVFCATTSFQKFDDLDTEQKIVDYYSETLVEMDKFRNQKIQEYLQSKSELGL